LNEKWFACRIFKQEHGEGPKKSDTGKGKKGAEKFKAASQVSEDGDEICNENKKIVDFDKLMRKLKFQSKLVEIQQPSTKQNTVCHASSVLCSVMIPWWLKCTAHS
jgi:hypothetical protein